MAHTVSNLGVRRLDVPREYFFLPCVGTQPAQWGYLDLHQRNCWHKVEKPYVGLLSPGKGFGYSGGLLCQPWPLPGPIQATLPQTHYTPHLFPHPRITWHCNHQHQRSQIQIQHWWDGESQHAGASSESSQMCFTACL